MTYELDSAPKKNGRKIVIHVRLGEATFTDRVDLYAFRSRSAFATQVAETFARKPDDVLGHLALVLDTIERSQVERKPESVVLTEARKRAAERLLQAPDLLDRAAHALESLGYVGEEQVKRIVYLVATSRLLARPLSGILFASSGAGKSELLDRVAQLIPDESVEFLSRVTPQALYYAGQDHLRHKLVLVDEQAGASEADYAIRTLQSKGYLRLAVPVRGRVESFEARGPIALLSGTTRETLNPENVSRCLELSLDDSAEQTKRVQEAQRRAWAGEKAKAIDTVPWQDAQRLLEPLDVVIPFASHLDYPSRTTKDRRDNAKLLSLVAAHALLHQFQREKDGRRRVVATLDDYRIIYGLLRPLVDQELDGLSPRASTLFRSLLDAPSFTRREAAAHLSWGYNTVKRALAELLAQELVKVTEHETPKRYALLDGSLASAAALKSPEELCLSLPGDCRRIAKPSVDART
ncbi:hypothetical protein HY251_14475 [bacterium]|nr:hypothetical protein [bacterium]